MVSRFRLSIIALVIFSAYGYLAYNLYELQISRGRYYSARAESQYRLAGFLEPYRGIIYFTDKEKELVPAAINKSYPVVFAVPKEIEDAPEAVAAIAPILGLAEDELKTIFSNKKSFYRLLLKKTDAEQTRKIGEVGVKGVYVDQREFRSYPFGDLAAHLLGFVGPTKEEDQLSGRYGVERQFNQLLGGVPGKISGDAISRPIQGGDLALTIDRNIQARAEEILRNLVKKYQARGGSVIVQDPKTGNLLALGGFPSFDPNEYQRSDIGSFLNPVIQAIYEPGSIFKIITMAIGLDLGKIAPDTAYTDYGHLTMNGRVIKNWDLKAHGRVTMTDVIGQSINTGSVFAAQKIGQKDFYRYLTAFGFNQPTSVQLPNEIAGSIENIKKPEDIHLATASFGQGISVTPLALINAVSAIANGGVLMKPNILAGEKPKAVKKVISKKAADQITEMMVSAVNNAKIARVPNYKVAGKTGTAQVPDFNVGGYTDEVINTYIGFAPATDSKFTALIKLDQPAGAPLAGLTVVPAFRELAEFILNYYNAPPDDLSKMTNRQL